MKMYTTTIQMFEVRKIFNEYLISLMLTNDQKH